ncbi:glycine cleavage system protein GcvH [Sedimentibacter sp. MB31-C6]|uniref:glycine cleavage system protein GcvH n=1 Tax=Sedimentibacter sp. MB31-C6 TaxID=3109366 RepID=UPI002DDCDCDB|nr:glycine cleavage system protein GcvH [Sedimentibacter sp. MB36-C1]WSI05244.1 glycine cleavage system protein GcvH [Sedimentibacter sp. MB36-C1]
MKVLKELIYSDLHEWVKIEGNIAYIGISDYAQNLLGEIVYADLPDIDTVVERGDQFIVLESEKDASDIFAPLSGTVAEINEELIDNPGLINESPYEAWIVALEMTLPAEADDLLSPDDYEKLFE